MKIKPEDVKTIGSGLLAPGRKSWPRMTVRFMPRTAGDAVPGLTGKARQRFSDLLAACRTEFASTRKANCIIANIGNGEVQSLSPDGRHAVLMKEAGGRRMSTPNFPFVDSRKRLWVSNSTESGIDEALREMIPDGCVVLIDNDAPQIGCRRDLFANGIALDPEEEVCLCGGNDEKACHPLRDPDDGWRPGVARPARGVWPRPAWLAWGFPTGLPLMRPVNLWVTFPAWNAIGYIDPDGNLEIVLEGPGRKVLQRPTNICFGLGKQENRVHRQPGRPEHSAFRSSLSGSAANSPNDSMKP